MIQRLAHLCLLTNQLDHLVAFYRDKLGLPVKFHYRGPEGNPIGTYLELGHSSFIEIFDYANAHRRWGTAGPPPAFEEPSDPRRARFQHFALQVDDMDRFVAQLEAAGVVVTGRKRGNDNTLQAWLKDPDGNSIELSQFTPESRQLTGVDWHEAR